jgi:hypothetical protein
MGGAEHALGPQRPARRLQGRPSSHRSLTLGVRLLALLACAATLRLADAQIDLAFGKPAVQSSATSLACAALRGITCTALRAAACPCASAGLLLAPARLRDSRLALLR